MVSTHATADIARDVTAFVLPRSENGGRLVATAIIFEEAPYLAGRATQQTASGTDE